MEVNRKNVYAKNLNVDILLDRDEWKCLVNVIDST